MAGFRELLREIQEAGNAYDVVRRRHIAALSDFTGRNTIIYYSAWLDKPELYERAATSFVVSDTDKSGFMATIQNLDRSKGLDLLLHTPGGDTAATESLVNYLRSMFGKDIRAVVPQLAMSAGTMIACACSEIVMGKHSSLGPVDPQFGGIPAHGVIEEFATARDEIRNDPSCVPLWQPIIAKYHPTFVGECQKAIDWSQQMVSDWLRSGMFDGDANADATVTGIVDELGSHALTLSHNRHIDIDRARGLGLKVTALEEDDQFQDAVLTVHHAATQSLAGTGAIKIIENHMGVAYVKNAQLAAFVPVPQ